MNVLCGQWITKKQAADASESRNAVGREQLQPAFLVAIGETFLRTQDLVHNSRCRDRRINNLHGITDNDRN